MDRVASLAPPLAADGHEVSEAARRYYSDNLWRSEPGGALALYSKMKDKLEVIKRRAEKRARPA
jgi:Rps23 Pro-64 3,4-dihydroxylase Tpa1-like proline 4-hydroxylase